MSYLVVLNSIKSPTVTAREKGHTTYMRRQASVKYRGVYTELSPPKVNPPTPMSATRPPTTDKPRGSSLE